MRIMLSDTRSVRLGGRRFVNAPEVAASIAAADEEITNEDFEVRLRQILRATEPTISVSFSRGSLVLTSSCNEGVSTPDDALFFINYFQQVDHDEN